MKAVLISIKPKWCELIAQGKKIVEVRKTKPNIDVPFKCYIYCTNEKTIGDIILCKSKENSKLFGYNVVKGINKGFAKKEDINLKGKVIGEFVCDYISPFRPKALLGDSEIVRKSCVNVSELIEYAPNKPFPNDHIYGWHITDLVIYDKPKELGEFKIVGCKGCRDKDTYHCKFWSEGERRIKRPPQSWCYVEELGV